MREVNGQQYQHATTKAVAMTTGGMFNLQTFTKIEYKVAAPKKPTHDSQGQVDGFTIDKQENTGALAMKLSEWLRFRAWLMQQNPGMGVLQCAFDLPVSFGNAVNAIKTDTLRGCMVQEDPRTSSDSQDALMVELPLFFLSAQYADGNPVVYE